ncbi:hypothetical protein C8R44DRAFT_869274 [Mycena epipterygia]|nr:hypothetical protein C8R44DRAFT_869274 [Mycena epipterygia]
MPNIFGLPASSHTHRLHVRAFITSLHLFPPRSPLNILSLDARLRAPPSNGLRRCLHYLVGYPLASLLLPVPTRFYGPASFQSIPVRDPRAPRHLFSNPHVARVFSFGTPPSPSRRA